MASGKKGKKTKGKTFALTDFLQETSGSIPVQPIRKSTINWADEVEDYDGYESRKPVNVVLPTAPKASRDFDDFSDQIPKEPPYIAYLSNLPYDVDEDEISAFFKNMRISSMRIPRDDRNADGPRSKGYGYIEFEDRESLLEALVLRDTVLKNRRMRIEVAANVGNERRGRMDMNRDRGERSDSFGDWRSGPRTDSHDNEQRGGFSREGGFNRDGGFSRDRDSGFNRDRDSGFNRDRDSGFNRDRDSGFSRDGMRSDRGYGRDNSGFNRDNRDSYRNNRDRDDDKPGGWRDGDRSNRDDDRNRGFSRRDNFRDMDRNNRFDDREDRRGYGSRRFDDRERDRDNNSKDDKESETSEPRVRPKLMLAARTIPIENVPAKTETVPSSSIFGNAKPVDSAKREMEIEKKLAKEHEPGEKRDSSRDRKDRARDSSRDRKDRARDSSRERKDRGRDGSRDRPRDGSRDTKNVNRSRDGSYERASERPNDANKDRKNYSSEQGDHKYGDKNKPSRPSDDSYNKDRNTKDRPPPRKTFDEKRGPPKPEHKSPEKNDNRPKVDKPRKEEKRERHEKEMPKMTEVEPPNFAASNKFAFLQTEEDNSE